MGAQYGEFWEYKKFSTDLLGHIMVSLKFTFKECKNIWMDEQWNIGRYTE